MRVGEVMEFEVDQVVTRQDHMDGLGQTATAKKANPDLPWNTGSKGPDVVKLQTILLRWGYPIGTADGIYGAKTKKAVQLVQQKARALADTMTDPAKIARVRSLPTTGVFDGVTATLFDQVGTSEEKLVSAGEADKKAVAAAGAAAASSGPTPGVVPPAPTATGGTKPVTEAAPALTTPTTGTVTSMTSGGFQQYLDKAKQFVKDQPVVAAGAAVAVVAGLFLVLRRAKSSNPAPAMSPGTAGLGEWHMPKRKKRRKSRKSKK